MRRRRRPLVGYSPRAGGAVCRDAARDGALALSPGGRRRDRGAARAPLAEAAAAALTERAAREALAVVTASYEYHGGFRLRTLRSA